MKGTVSLPRRLKNIAIALLKNLGLYVFTKGSVPKGVDWCLDLTEHLRNVQVKTIFDVGANTGQTAVEVHRAFPEAKVLSFEPVHSTFLSLKNGTQNYPWLSCYNIALSSQRGTAAMTSVPGSVTNSLALNVPQHKAAELAGQEATEVVVLETIDQFGSENHIERIEILKIDTEGHDLEVLRGAKTYFASSKVLLVYVEVTFALENPRNSLFYPIDDFLKENGFVFMGLYETYFLHKHPQDLTFCNALFLNPAAVSLAITKDGTDSK